jgi:hypothetical protein
LFIYIYIYTILIVYFVDSDYRKAAERRRKHPELPWNPENPYDRALAPAQHMQSNSQASVSGSYATNLEDTESIATSITQSLTRPDNTHLSSSQAYAESMPPPSSNQSHRSYQKRHRSQVSADNTSIAHVAARVNDLQQRVLAAREKRERALLLQQEAALQRELEELESDL